MEKSDWDSLVDSLVRERILKSPDVIKAMRTVPRTLFVPEEMRSYSSQDTPLPIGLGQTISAPHMVSIMNEALKLEIGHQVLEIGAGSGWHAATIAEIIAPADAPRSHWGHVYSTEIIQAMAERARKTIMTVGYGDRVTVINTDGAQGYPEKAPYDRILVTAAAPETPNALIDQLKPGGTMLIPLGKEIFFQTLYRLTKERDGKIKQENLGGVAFVPLTGRYGHQSV